MNRAPGFPERNRLNKRAGNSKEGIHARRRLQRQRESLARPELKNDSRRAAEDEPKVKWGYYRELCR